MILAFLVAIIVIADQVSKFLVRAFMTEGQSIEVIKGFFSLTYVNNEGVAFSFLSGHRAIVTTIQILCTCLILWLFFANKGKNAVFDVAMCLIIAGGIGNIIDRVLYGKVTDMISFSIFPPVFNIADIAVTVGCFLVIVYFFMDYKTAK